MLFLFPFLLAISVVACEKQTHKSEGAFSEAVGKNTLESNAFGILVEAPNGWHAPDQSTQNALVDTGGNIASSGDKEPEAMIETSKKKTWQLFGIFRHLPGAAVESNPDVLAMTEDVSRFPGMKSGSDCFPHFKRAAQSTYAIHELRDPITTIDISGAKFDRLETRITSNGATSEERHYAPRRRDHVV